MLNQGDYVDSPLGITPEKFIPTFVKGGIGLFEDPNTWRSSSPAKNVTVGTRGTDWQAKGKKKKNSRSRADLAPGTSGKILTTTIRKVSSMTDIIQ